MLRKFESRSSDEDDTWAKVYVVLDIVGLIMRIHNSTNGVNLMHEYYAPSARIKEARQSHTTQQLISHDPTIQIPSILSSRCLQTRIRPSWYCRQMRYSSVKTISFQSDADFLLSSHHWWRRRLWLCVKGRPSNGRLAGIPLCCKRRQMVRADTEG
ncbi:hypothetical protein TNCV_45161 [Trichonephila clavipes]|nr:hypothetical protein TNCV_45161 [Trichonephila clavipes]